MKYCYMITFGSEVSDEYVFTDYEKARQRLQRLKDEDIENAKKHNDTSYEHWYELRVFKLVEQDRDGSEHNG